jgi:HEPN domain-containing protein
MTNEEMARGHLLRAGFIREECEVLLARGACNLVVRRSQESVELALKAVLRFSGVEIPQVRDVSAFLRRYRDRIPERLRANLDRLISISRHLAREREVSFYGDEDTGTPAEDLYNREDAEDALHDATEVLELCRIALSDAGSTPNERLQDY